MRQRGLGTPFLNFNRIGRLQEEGNRFSKIPASFFVRISLTGNIELRTKGNVSVALADNQRCDRIRPHYYISPADATSYFTVPSVRETE
jgi:hypothetical protein